MNIGKGTKFGKKWTLGEKLGEGGCASVYALQETDPAIGSLVIKCTKLPTGKSKADKEQLKIANTLNYERMLYKGVLNDFKYCVKLPQQSYYGEENSIRYLVMARMDYDLRHLATMSHRGGDKGGHTALSTQSLSLIGQQILEGLEILHSKGYLFVDVKPDNFMIRKNRSSSSSARGGGCDSNDFTLADELFFVDFGLAEKFTQYMSNGAQRERTMRVGLAGTPSYASIDLLEGHSPCRKDDLEALVTLSIPRLLNSSRDTFCSRSVWVAAYLGTMLEAMQNAFGLKETLISSHSPVASATSRSLSSESGGTHSSSDRRLHRCHQRLRSTICSRLQSSATPPS